MLVAVFGDAHAHAEAFDAVIGAAEASGVEELWSLGDMVGRGPDPEHVVARTRARCAVALMGNHDYGATGPAEPTRFGEPGSPAVRSWWCSATAGSAATRRRSGSRWPGSAG